MLTRRSALAMAVAAFFAPQAAVAQDRIPVVASFSILGDFVAEVGGDRIALTTIVGPDGDGHTYQPTPADAKAVTEAKVVFVNGLEFEGWFPRLKESSGAAAPIVESAKGIEAIKMDEAGHDHDHGHAHGHDHGEFDPHVWQSVGNAKVMVANIRDGLIAADPAGKATYEANAAAYLAELETLDAEIKATIAAIPQEKRKIITSHDAFGYFEVAYGIEFVAPQGVSTETEASARAVARIIRQIKREKIGAVFMENISDPRLIKRIADETGANLGGTLFSDALSGADGPAGTYIALMRHNIRALSAALGS